MTKHKEPQKNIVNCLQTRVGGREGRVPPFKPLQKTNQPVCKYTNTNVQIEYTNTNLNLFRKPTNQCTAHFSAKYKYKYTNTNVQMIMHKPLKKNIEKR